LERARRLLVAAAVLALAGCGGGGGGGQTTTSAARTIPPLDPAKTYDVTFATSSGSFTVRLAVKTSPHTTASVVSLVRKGFYDGTVFHRIIPGFVIQGGDPTGTGTGGPGYTTVDAPPASTRYVHGVAAMAKTQAQPAGTAGSQFFVMTADSSLPPDYAVLGRVVKGLAVVDRIGRLGDPAGTPTRRVVIRHATIAER
jgi:peptidyl-prolyl cis-trans isomerase B (cyclophilin B)